MIKKIVNFLKIFFEPILKILSFFKKKPVDLTGINCIMRLGLPGSGKTLDQTIFDVLPHLLNGEEVWCSYWLNWNKPNLHLFNEFETVENLRNCVVVFDEIGQILPARQWELEGLRVQLFFQLHRHRHLDIIGNTQDVSLVAKTVGIVANKWFFIQKANNWLLDFFGNMFNLGHISYTRTQLTYAGLKKMANGWEVEGVMPTTNRRDKHIKKFLTIDKLKYKNLDEYKIELVHKYCPKCAMRQGKQILKEDTLIYCKYNSKTDTYTLREKEYCPKHKEQLLEIRHTGIYDTDHEPDFPEKTITFQPLIESPKGYTKIKYQGKLSNSQLNALKGLNKHYNS